MDLYKGFDFYMNNLFSLRSKSYNWIQKKKTAGTKAHNYFNVFCNYLFFISPNFCVYTRKCTLLILLLKPLCYSYLVSRGSLKLKQTISLWILSCCHLQPFSFVFLIDEPLYHNVHYSRRYVPNLFYTGGAWNNLNTWFQLSENRYNRKLCTQFVPGAQWFFG